MCENCNEKSDIIEQMGQEIKDLEDRIKTLETESSQIDKWIATCPR